MSDEIDHNDLTKLDIDTLQGVLEMEDDVEKADISGLDLYQYSLVDHKFVGCVVDGAIFTDISLESSVWENCSFIGASFKSVDMSHARFRNCQFYDRKKSIGGSFRFSTMNHAEFDACDMTLAELFRCDAHGIAFKKCRMLGANLSEANFSRLFSKTVIRTEAIFQDCNLEQADFAAVNLSQCEIVDCNLTDAVLSQANLFSANMQRSVLVDAVVSGANFGGADLRGCEVDGLNLLDMANYEGLMITHDHAPGLLRTLGIDVYPG